MTFRGSWGGVLGVVRCRRSGCLDGYGPLPAALARQIAAEAARDHPTTTTWRCVVVDDRHATVLGVGGIIPTPRYIPTGRQKTFTRTADPFCVFPGCRTQAWRCDLDHRIPYNHDNPAQGGPTCTCNLQSLCRRHHRLKTAGPITPHLTAAADDGGNGATDGDERGGSATPDRQRVGTAPVEDGPVVLGEIPGTTPPGSVEWRTWTGRRYSYQPPRATPTPADPEIVAGCATRSQELDETGESRWLGSDDPALANWDRARRRLLEREAVREARRRQRDARTHAAWQDNAPDAPAPF